MDKLLSSRETLLVALIKANEKYHNNDQYILYDIINPIVKDEQNFYLSLADELGKVTYAKDRNDKLNEKKRIKTSFRRFLRRQLDIDSHKYSDDWLNRFGCEVLSFLPFDMDTRVKLLTGNDIVKFYSSTFIDTCMTGKGNKDKIEFYSVNSDKISLAVMDNFIRALIWQTDEGHKVMDRIYPAGNSDAEIMFRKWATDKGYKLRSNSSGLVPVTEMVGIEGGVTLNVTVLKHNKYPYLDTFRFGIFRPSTLVLSNSPIDKQYVFTRANGSFNQFMCCHSCGRVCTKNVTRINNNYVCEKCVIDNYYRCVQCGLYFFKLGINKAQSDMLLKTKYFYCESCYSYLY